MSLLRPSPNLMAIFEKFISSAVSMCQPAMPGKGRRRRIGRGEGGRGIRSVCRREKMGAEKGGKGQMVLHGVEGARGRAERSRGRGPCGGSEGATSVDS